MKYIKKFERYKNLNYAIYDDEEEVIIKMIDDGYDVNEIDMMGNTPLIWCSIEKHLSVKVAKKLIENGAKLDTINVEGSTALINASIRKNYPVMFALIDAGADWNIKEKIFNTDFMFYLDDNVKKDIINKYPEKYKQYLIKKEIEKYNL